MKFQMPDKLDGLELTKVVELHAAALAEATELNQIPDDKITAEETAELIELAGHVAALSEHRVSLEAAAEQSAAALATARAAVAAVADSASADDADAESGDEDAEGGDTGGDSDDNGEEDAEDKIEEKEVVMAAASKSAVKRTFASKVADTKGVVSDNDVDKVLENSGALSITASANVPGFNTNQELNGFDDLAKAYSGRARAFAGGTRSGRRGAKGSVADVNYGGHKLSDSAQRFSVAKLTKPENEFTITEKMSAEDQYDLIMRAASEKRLGSKGLIAAGGWCAPSEIMYGFLELETAEGLLSIPEIAARRGGIQFTKGPQLGDLLLEANLGFVQTEAEAEAGEVKPIFDIECPDWDEVRMDAVGYAIRAGLLTNAAYPELIRRYLALGLVVHARRMNALTIQRISALIGAATTFAPVGAQPSATADLLSSIELNALRIREQYSMALNATVEGIFPLWVQAIVRSDLSRRTGVDMLSVTDQQINSWFAQRQINAQFVRDYQGINSGAVTTPGGTAAWTAWPTQVEYMLYPAGSFVRLATDVIDLDTVYDTDNLTQNQFLAAFFEEGFGIANTGGSGVKVNVGLPNLYGSTGYPSIGALANVAPATP